MKCTCNHNLVLNVNDISKIDPAGLLPLKYQMIKDVEERFKWIQAIITEALAVRDVLDLNNANSNVVTLEKKLVKNISLTVEQAVDMLESRAFNFTTSASKIQGFMDWLEDMEEVGVLETFLRPGRVSTGIKQPWSNLYIDSAYQKGILRSRQEMESAGIDITKLDNDPDREVDILFNKPFHAERVALLHTRTFNELKGITKEMDRQISNILAEGMVDGKSGKQIARELNNRVQKIGITRARTLARTEIQRAHHQANINEYEAAQVQGVVVLAEWATGVNPCPICATLSGEVFSLKQIRMMIPVHPNCVCVAIPYQPGIDGVKGSVKGSAGWLPNCSDVPHDVMPLLLSRKAIITNAAKSCLNSIDKRNINRALKKSKPVNENERKNLLKEKILDFTPQFPLSLNKYKKYKKEINTTWKGKPRKNIGRRALDEIIIGEYGENKAFGKMIFGKENDLKGVVSFTPNNHPKKKGNYLYIDYLATKEKGYGLKSFKEVVKEADKLKSGIFLDSAENAVGFYEKIGMINDGENMFTFSRKQIKDFLKKFKDV